MSQQKEQEHQRNEIYKRPEGMDYMTWYSRNRGYWEADWEKHIHETIHDTSTEQEDPLNKYRVDAFAKR